MNAFSCGLEDNVVAIPCPRPFRKYCEGGIAAFKPSAGDFAVCRLLGDVEQELRVLICLALTLMSGSVLVILF